MLATSPLALSLQPSILLCHFTACHGATCLEATCPAAAILMQRFPLALLLLHPMRRHALLSNVHSAITNPPLTHLPQT